MFNLEIELLINQRMLTAPPMTIEADIEFSRAGKGSTMELSIYNVAPATKTECEKKGTEAAKIILNAGYKDEGGKSTTFMGDIIKTDVDPGVDEAFKITAADATAKFLNVPVSVSYQSKMQGSKIIADVASKAGITASEIDLVNDLSYETFAVNSTLGKFLDRMSRESGTHYFFRQGQLIFIKQKPGTAKAIDLNYNSGLLFAEKIGDKRIKVQAVFQNKIMAGSYTAINSEKIKGNYIVDKGNHHLTSQSESTTEFEAVAL